MSRRRPRASFRSELPLKASAADPRRTDFDDAIALLHAAKKGHRSRIRTQFARIARDHKDGRKWEAQRVPAPKARVCLECLTADAAKVRALIDQAPPETRQKLSFISLSPQFTKYPLLGHDFAFLVGEIATVLGVENFVMATAVHQMAKRLWSLPMKAEWALVELQQYVPFSMVVGTCEPSEVPARFLKWLSDLAAVAAEGMKAERGPKSNVTQMKTVQRLKELFEYGGFRVTHNAKLGRNYEGLLVSQFGQFVETVMRSLDDPRQLRGLADAVSFAAWPSRCRNKSRRVAAETDARSQLLERCLQARGVAIFSPQPVA